MYIDLKNIDKLDPERRKQFDKLLEAYPELRSKMETSRDLNTGDKAPPPPPPQAPAPKTVAVTAQPEDDNALDYDTMRPEQPTYEAIPKPIGSVQVDAANHDFKPSFTMAEKEEQKKKEEEEKARQAGRPQPKKEPQFSIQGKDHPVLAKLKATLGMKYEAPFVCDVGGTKYALTRVMRDDIVKATSLAALRSQTHTELKANIEAAILGYSVIAIDGIKIEEVFQIPTEEESLTTGKIIALSPPERKEKAHIAMCDFLREAPNELCELLVQYYEQEFPNIDLIEKDKTYGYCPADACNYKRIIGKTDIGYCPLHGKKLTQEQDLPNPF